MSDPSDRTIPERPLTRRELREHERLSLLPTADQAVPAAVTADPAADLTADAGDLVGAELHEPDLEAAVLTESDREIAAPPAAEARGAGFDLLLEPGTTASLVPGLPAPTTASSIVPLPTRARLRSEEHAARGSRPRRSRTAPNGGPRTPEAKFAPTRTFVPTPSPARSTSTAPSSNRVRKLAAKGATIVAMAFVALMAVSTSLPAEALLSSSDVQASALAAQRPTQTEPSQKLAVAGGDTISVKRDGYESSTIAQVAAASGIRMEATFTNDPSGTIQWPFAVGVHIGDQFGPRNCAGCSSNHQGQDFNPGVGAPIQAVADGVVSLAEDGEGSLGVHMIIDHMIDGKLVSSVYGHMIHGSMNFKVGDVVKVGQVIGKTGSTGMSTGPHLHFEIREGGKDGQHVDPLKWLYANTN